MTVLQCGGCDRLISVSMAPGGNPVAKADPARWSLTHTVCPACGKCLCDRCAPGAATQCPLCKAALARADSADDGGDEVARTELVEARRWLVAAILGAVVATLAITGKSSTVSSVLVVLGVVFTCLGGWNGVGGLVRAGVAAPGWKLLGPVGFLMPYVSLFPLAWLLWRGHSQLSALEEERERGRVREAARERARRRAHSNPVNGVATVAPPRPAGRGTILNATAAIRTVGLEQCPDGKLLEMRFEGQEQRLPDDQQPVVMAYKGFGVVFLIDDGDSYHFAQRGEMQAAGLAPETLLLTGLRNLVKRVNGNPGLTVAPNGAMHAVLMGGDFEASLLLLDELWDGAMKLQAPGGFVVAIPARDICAFADANSPQGIAELRELAARVTARAGDALSPHLYARRNGAWVPLP
jgi:hypothetical protein